MKTSLIAGVSRVSEAGNALILAMATIAVLVSLVAITVSYSSGNALRTTQDESFVLALNAADGALEYAFAAWKGAVAANGLRPPSNATMNVPAPTPALHSGFAAGGVTFSNFQVLNSNQWGETVDKDGKPITSPVSVSLATIPGHPGWAGTASFARATVTANVPSRKGPVAVSVGRTFQVTGIPLFQAAIFFEHDIELHPGVKMMVKGLVHTNSDLWTATSAAGNLQFLANVSYVGKFSEAYRPSTTFGGGSTGAVTPNPPIWADGLPASTSATVAQQLHRTERLEPFGTEPAFLFNTTDSNPNNDGPREAIETPVAAASDPPEIAATRIYGKASVRVKIDRTKTGASRIVIRDGSDGALPASDDAAIRGALNVSTAAVFDWREATPVSMTNVNMKTLDAALDKMGSRFNGVIYLEDATVAGKNAIRLQNGAVLTKDLTVASSNGVYIQGDYNTGGETGGVHDPLLVPSNNGGNPDNTKSPVADGYNKRSCAVMGDAVMILSNNWNDTNASLALVGRIASHTTVNSAILSGIVPTNFGGSNVYSGGPHNFPRFLENWAGKDLTYLGSMVQTFNSEQFVGAFDTGNTYSPPGRKWSFDSLFLSQPPPGTFQSVSFSRGRWERL